MRVLKSDCVIKKGYYAENLRGFFKFYDELHDELIKDNELLGLLKSYLNEKCYSDPQIRTLTVDFGFCTSRYYSGKDDKLNEEWYDAPLSKKLTKEEWTELLINQHVFNDKSIVLMGCFKDIGGVATCTDLSKKYGRAANYYLTTSWNLAKRVISEHGIEMPNGERGNEKYWPVLYLGRIASKDEAGGYIWKLRPELQAALDEYDFSGIKLIEEKTDMDENINYWWLNANPKIWSFSEMSVGEEQDYTLYNDNGNKRKIFQNFLDAKEGDLVIGYESTPVKQVVGIAKVSREQDGKSLYFEKIESLETPIDYKTLKDCDELAEMEYFANPQGSLFKLKKDEYDFIIDMIREENPISHIDTVEKYTEKDFLRDVFMSETRYNQLSSILDVKQNVILQGAPGVGKTYAAKRLAYAKMGEKNDDRIELIQFHQNYSYEDFIMGYKPEGSGFELKYGIFYRFCKKAENHPDKKYFFIIDEINRGNLSKIFGELLMLLESDYRHEKASLAYNGMPFSVPGNLYLIGMMNTADRSLAMIDYALRRRFSFFEMRPGFDSDGFIKYKSELNNERFNTLISVIKDLNEDIRSDKSLGKGFCIGHSYFCNRKPENCTDAWMKAVVDFDIKPTLEEYWFDDDKMLNKWINALDGVFDD